MLIIHHRVYSLHQAPLYVNGPIIIFHEILHISVFPHYMFFTSEFICSIFLCVVWPQKYEIVNNIRHKPNKNKNVNVYVRKYCRPMFNELPSRNKCVCGVCVSGLYITQNSKWYCLSWSNVICTSVCVCEREREIGYKTLWNQFHSPFIVLIFTSNMISSVSMVNWLQDDHSELDFK
jgi:hypothetical protein